MKILVFSDSHGNHSNMEFALTSHGASVGMVIFLGDGVRDIEYIKGRHPAIPFVISEGNFERPFGEVPMIFDEYGLKFFCAHGHTFGVKTGMEKIKKAALDVEADILLYGHTHKPDNQTVQSGDRNLLIFNPGSVGSGYHPSYGVIDIPKKGVYVASHAIL